MPLLGNLAVLAMWQDATAVVPANDIHLLTYSVVTLAAISLIQFLALIIGSLVVYAKVTSLSANLERKAQPLLQKTQGLVDDLTPKVRTIMENAQQISYSVRSKVDEIGQTVTKINETVQDTNSKTREQVSRVNGLVSEALTTTHEVSRSVQDSIKAPIRQVAGVIAGMKAALETLAERSPLLKVKPAPQPITPLRVVSNDDLS